MSIQIHILNGVFTIEIARPAKKNSLTMSMYEALAEAFISAAQQPEVRAVLVTGGPSVFTAGNDVEDFLKCPPNSMDAPLFKFMPSMMECPKPVIAAVNGPAIGIGTTMLLHCDLVYVADTAKLAMPFVALGLVPEFAASLNVVRLVGATKAAELLLLGKALSGSEAVALGIANAVLPAADVLDYARGMAERFNELPPGAVQETKKLLRRWSAQEVAEAVAVEGAQLVKQLDSAEAKEAFSAFLEKRKPIFNNA